MSVEICSGPVFFIHVETVSWKGLPQAVTLFILGQQDSRYFHLIHYPLLYYLCSAQWTSFIFINKDKFKLLKPTWGESSPSPQTNTCSLGTIAIWDSLWDVCQRPWALPPRYQSSPPPETCPDLTGCPLGLACPWWEPPRQMLSWQCVFLSILSIIMKIISVHLSISHTSRVLQVGFRSLLTRADRSCFSFSVVNETNCRWPVTR